MKRFAITISILAALALGVGLIVQQCAFADNKQVDFTLKDVNGKDVTLSNYRGKVVLIDVWATWCHYCVEEIPALKDMQAQASKDKTNLRIIGISVDTDKDAVKKCVKDNAINYPVVYAEKEAMKQFGRIYGYPTKFIVNEKGEVVEKIVGAVEKADLQKRLAKYVKAVK